MTSDENVATLYWPVVIDTILKSYLCPNIKVKYSRDIGGVEGMKEDEDEDFFEERDAVLGSSSAHSSVWKVRFVVSYSNRAYRFPQIE